MKLFKVLPLFIALFFTFASVNASAETDTVRGWGRNYNGQLGDNTNTDSTTPVQASGISGVMVVEGGGSHSTALKADGTVWSWGINIQGQLGIGSIVSSKYVPTQTVNITDVIAIAGYNNHTAALKSDGTVWTWGDNYYGQLGDGTDVDRISPVQITDLTNVADIGVGAYASIAVKSDGTVWMWEGIHRWAAHTAGRRFRFPAYLTLSPLMSAPATQLP